MLDACCEAFHQINRRWVHFRIKNCVTFHPDPKSGFRIESDKPWLRFNSSFLFKVSQSTDLPQLSSYAWENCKQIRATNKNCTSFYSSFAKETNNFELFNC